MATSFRPLSSALETESSRALGVLTRWAAHYAERRKTLSTRDTTTPETLIQKTHTRQLVAREKAFARHLPFSWLRFFAGMVSLMLVLSDVVRGGVGVSSLEKAYPALQPDQVLGFGSTWNYSVFSATKREAASMTALVWIYKYDSTSISWRAFGRHLAVRAFPECFFYVEPCANESIGGDAVFNLIDALVEAIANVSMSQREDTTTRNRPTGLMLRTENEYVDRLHQFLLPAWFKNINWRTNQALHYSAELLGTSTAGTICFPGSGRHMRTPRFCQHIWTNLERSCAPTDARCKAVGLLYVHTMERLQGVRTKFPTSSVDLTFLESQEDMQVNRGGLSSLGFGRSDISTIIRARTCSDSGRTSHCETKYVDEYRYETGLLTTDVIQWYWLVAALRITGQSYFWLRGIGLMLSCFFVFGNPTDERSSSMRARLRKARRLFMKVPTQSVLYGSPFPVACYVLAHLLDAPYTYQVLESHFFSQAGVVDIKLESFVSYAVVQMRSVWVYALTWQLTTFLTQSRAKPHANRLNSGLVGVPEFLLSAFSFITLLAQYRMTSIRSAKILQLMELPSNVGPAWEAVKYQYGFVHRGRGNVLLGGVIIDLKFLVCFCFIVAVWWAAYTTSVHIWASLHKEDNHRYAYSHWCLLPPTPVPYSAGVLWPSVSTCVHWTSDFYCIRNERTQDPELLQIVNKNQYRVRHPWRARVLWWRRGDARVLALDVSSSQVKYLPGAELRLCTRARRKTADRFRCIQHQMERLHCRSDDVEANVAFMNAVLLSDPLVFLRILFGNEPSNDLGYYQSKWRPKQVVLLPLAVVGVHNEYSSGLKLLRRVNASELTWAELVQCG